MRVSFIILTFGVLCSCEKIPSNPNLLVYGHAGASLNNGEWILPPNTLEAIEYGAISLGADGAELDVQMTKDSVLVLFHDDFLDPNLDLDGCIAQYTWAELKEEKVYKTKYTINSLIEGLNEVSRVGSEVLLDLKHHNACDETIRSISAYKFALENAFVGFAVVPNLNCRNLTFLVNLNVSFDHLKSWETDDIAAGIVAVQNGVVDELTLRASNVTQADADELHALDIPFTIFGARTQKELREAVKLNPKRIITDNIAYANKITN